MLRMPKGDGDKAEVWFIIGFTACVSLIDICITAYQIVALFTQPR